MKLFWLSYISKTPACIFQKFLRNEKIFKVGMETQKDGHFLAMDYGVTVSTGDPSFPGDL